MADIISSIASAVVGCFVTPIGRQLGYLFNYHSNVENLKTQVEKLEGVRGRMELSVNAARSNVEEIVPDVEKWLKNVNRIAEEAGEILLEDEDKAKKRCFNGLCPNLKTRYWLSKKAKKTTEKVVVEIQDGEKFGTVSYHPAPQGTIGSTPIKGYESFKSRMSTLKEIMEALRNPNINMIGVYGMGGVGKTMLVKEAARKAREDKLFDKVVVAVVSQPPNVRKIQEEIASPLGLRFDDKEIESERVERLCKRLNEEKSILIILDDVWAQLDLEALGIPLGDMQNGCKIVVTSRRLDLLFNQMNILHNFKIEDLHEEEAWNLFKKMAGDSVEAPEIEPTARKVAKECAGLPIAVVVVASALKKKKLHFWMNALYQLKKSAPTTIEGMDAKVYSSLKWSYDFLACEEQKLFLLCSLLPEDYQFSIQDLLYYGKGVGLFQGIEELETARNSVHASVDRLKDSCLLLDGDTSGLFKMHDVVRDVGISVAKDKQMLIVRNKVELEEWKEEKLKFCPALSLPYTDIHELPTGLESPQLKFFLFFSKDSSSKIPDTFFEEMKQLKVLTISNIHFSSLPSSLHFLSSLQTLCLGSCQLGDISIVGELKKLEILSFRGSNIIELPRDIGQLTCLKLLDLRYCLSLKVIPSNVIARLSQLEELYVANILNEWEVDGNASLAELKHLSRLVTLEIYIPDANILPNDLVFEKLKRFKILIGDVIGDVDKYLSSKNEISRTLNLAVNTSIHLLYGINKLLKRTEDLHLKKLNGFKSMINDLDGEGFPDLKYLHIENSSEIEYVINTMSSTRIKVPLSAFPNLESLLLKKLIKLKEICNGQLPVESFCNLRMVEVIDCDRLQNLFPLSVATSLSKLQKIKINQCKNMDVIVAEEREAAEDNNEAMDEIRFPQLHSLTLEDLPKLMCFCSKVKAVPSTSDAGRSKEIISEGEHGISIPLFNEKVAFPILEKLVIKSIAMKEIWHSQVPVESFCNLRKVEVIDCDRLQNLFPLSVATSLSKLQEIKINQCKNMDGIVAEGREAAEDNNEAMDEIRFPQLHSLILQDLPKLMCFCSKVKAVPSTSDAGRSKEIISEGEHGISIPLFNEKVAFPILEKLVIKSIAMKEIWHSQLPLPEGSFCKLKHLEVEDCFDLSKIVPSNMLTRQLQNDSPGVFPLEKLSSLEVARCPNLQNIFTTSRAKSLVQLQKVCIRDCDKIEEIVGKEGVDEEEATDKLVFPQVTSLHLDELPQLKSFCQGILTSEWPFLKTLVVIACYYVEILASKLKGTRGKVLFLVDKVAFPNLEELKLTRLPKLTTVWKKDSQGLFQDTGEEIVGKEGVEELFPQLTSLSFEFLPRLKNIGIHNSEWPSLKRLEVFFCDNVEILASEFSSFEKTSEKGHLGTPTKPVPLFLVNKVAFPNLEKLNLSYLPRLIAVWMKDSQGSLNFQKLSSLHISKCESLINVFTTSMAKNLAQLRDIVEEIIEKKTEEEEAEAMDKLMFPQVRFLTLRCLKQLKSFCEWNHISEWPSLKILEMYECHNVEIFASELSTFKETRGKANLGTPTKQPLFLVDKVAFPNLEEMELNQMSSMEVIWQGQLHAQSFSKLRVLKVEKCDKILKVFPFSLLRNLQNLEKLSIKDCCSLEDVFELGGFGKTEHASTFPPLKKLRLIRLPKLMHLWKEDSQLSAVFQNLTTLEVRSCESLTHVFISTIIEATYEKGKAIDETTVYQLYSLKLINLPNLTSFFPENNNFSFPRLKKVSVKKCPKLETLSPNIFRTLSKYMPVQENEWLEDESLDEWLEDELLEDEWL